MAETIITPTSPAELQAGCFVDDAGDRFVSLLFGEAEQRIVVTFTPALFGQYVDYLDRVRQAAGDEQVWADAEVRARVQR